MCHLYQGYSSTKLLRLGERMLCITELLEIYENIGEESSTSYVRQILKPQGTCLVMEPLT
jgi:hypothetical protein